MSRFTGPIDVRMTRSNEHGRPVWRLLSPLVYHVGFEGSPDVVEVPAGFGTDGVSVPLPFAWLVPVLEHSTFRPACVHDFLWTQHQAGRASGRSRREIDAILLEALLVMRVPRFKAYLMWAAVRLQAIWSGDR